MVADDGGDAELVQVSQGLAEARGLPLARQGWTPVRHVPIHVSSPAATVRTSVSSPTVNPEAEADNLQALADDPPPRKRPAILTTPKPQSRAPLPSKTKLPSLHRPLVETSSTPSRVNTGQEASTSELATESGLYYKVLYAKSKKCVRRNTKNWEVSNTSSRSSFRSCGSGCEFAWLLALTEVKHAILSMQDGVLELRGGKCMLYNDAGKKVTESKTKVSALREDDTLQVGGYDLEVYTSIAETDYFSGKAFMVRLNPPPLKSLHAVRAVHPATLSKLSQK